MGKKKSKKVRADLKKVRAELEDVRKELRRVHADLAAVAGDLPGRSGLQCAPKALLPKTECCGSKKKCARCPIAMLKQGTLPTGMTVKHRRLVGADGKRVTKKQLVRAA